METIKLINTLLAVIFLVCYAYQFFYIAVVYLKKKRPLCAGTPHRFAVLIAARNEEAVIGNLIASIRAQTYRGGAVEIFVVADNCTDRTAEAARAAGATVYPRFNTEEVGKGYALNFLLRKLEACHELFDGYFVFDADNVLDERYIEEMNRVFSAGYPIVTSYRNSKNYGDNWISAGYALWFLRESRFLNDARMRLGTSCAVSGTGFLFSREILAESGGWNFFLLTEDIEFTIHHVCRGRRVGFCADAVLYDEQPVSFRQSWRQRLRWAKGYLQVFGRYGGELLQGIVRGSFGCFDMTMNIMPAAVLSVAGIANNLAALLIAAGGGFGRAEVLRSALSLLSSAYLTLFLIGAVTVAHEWRQICAPARKKIVSVLTFPLFMLTYIPISLAAIFARRVTWKPIEHRRVLSLDEVRGNQ